MGFFRRYQQKFEHSFERLRHGYRRALTAALDRAWVFSAFFLAFCILSGGLVFFLGRDFFPSVDAGQIRLHMRARTGLRIEETTRLADEVDAVIREVIPTEEVQTVIDNVGLPYQGINLRYSNSGTIGTSDAEILVQLKAERGKSTTEYINELRRRLASEISGSAVFFPAGGHRHADSEFWHACADRRADHGREPVGKLRDGGKAGEQDASIFRVRWTYTCSRRLTSRRYTWTWIARDRNMWGCRRGTLRRIFWCR